MNIRFTENKTVPATEFPFSMFAVAVHLSLGISSNPLSPAPRISIGIGVAAGERIDSGGNAIHWGRATQHLEARDDFPKRR